MLSHSGQNLPQSAPPHGSGVADPRYRCGTLVYTKAGLFTLFAWLLWGDFCFSLMEAVWPNVLPLMLKSNGAPDMVLSLVITTIPCAMNFVMNPIISTISDRYRSRRGRRMPFLLAATPFISIFLILLGFSGPLAKHLHRLLSESFPGLSAATVTVVYICIIVTIFRFFELFVNTVFWYLFNDVVPTAFMGRFLGFFRVVGSLAGALFYFFLFRYAESHTSLIFFAVAVLYGTVFMLMCLNVKEGSYPPPEVTENRPAAHFSTFFRECFGYRIFRLVFAYSAISALAVAVNTFMIFMAFSLGLTLKDVGQIAGVAGAVGMLLMYPMGSLVDRHHPLRIMVAAQAGLCVVVAGQLIFLFHEFSPDVAFWIYAALAGVAIPINVANAAAALPMFMRIFPQDRFGQFCAANAMCGASASIVGGVLAGAFLGLMKSLCTEGTFYYRFIPLWSLFFTLLSVWALVRTYCEWKKLGGDSGYRPPLPDRFAALDAPDPRAATS